MVTDVMGFIFQIIFFILWIIFIIFLIRLYVKRRVRIEFEKLKKNKKQD